MPTLSQEEFEAILADDSKRIVGDVSWSPDPTKPGAFRFRADVNSDADQPMFIAGYLRISRSRLSYALIYAERRIAAIDFGAVGHRNVDGAKIIGTHVHLWDARYQATEAYSVTAITAQLDQPLEAWAQFCGQFGIVHQGEMLEPGNEGSKR